MISVPRSAQRRGLAPGKTAKQQPFLCPAWQVLQKIFGQKRGIQVHVSLKLTRQVALRKNAHSSPRATQTPGIWPCQALVATCLTATCFIHLHGSDAIGHAYQVGLALLFPHLFMGETSTGMILCSSGIHTWLMSD